MNKKIYSILLAVSLVFPMLTSCSDWLEVEPDDKQVDYWNSKEEVEAIISSAYYRMRQAVPTIIKWGELRGGAMFTSTNKEAKLQDFVMTADNALCDYDYLYQVIGYANSVIQYAPQVQAKDNTYYDAVMNSHLCEAYFLRAYSYLLLVKNFKEVPLVLEPYVNDSQEFNIAKSSEDSIVAQVKADMESALATKAAKSTYETDWETKGRVTKWALYALMADACLWSEDYDKCITYCDLILNADQSGESFYPKFLSRTQDWYTIFYPGNSNEGIFELNWDYETENSNNNFTSLFPSSGSSGIMFTTTTSAKMTAENDEVALTSAGSERTGRMNLATYVESGGTKYLWKYRGNDVADIEGGLRLHNDANFIIYRVAEIIMMKAQAEAMKGNLTEALKMDNMIRARAGLSEISDEEMLNYNEETVLDEILEQKELEFLGEGKRWYDLLWLGRISNYKYKTKAIQMICQGNQTTNEDWIVSALNDNYAWYIPLPSDDIEHNQLLVQNPYYSK